MVHDSASVTHMVTSADTALALRSGDVDVLGTPRLLAWCEEASCAALHLDPGQTSVSSRTVNLEHLAASAIGTEITASATVIHIDGRLVRFEVVVHDATGRLVATGELRRVIVDRERFLSRIPPVGD